jgi:hypothetical protein
MTRDHRRSITLTVAIGSAAVALAVAATVAEASRPVRKVIAGCVTGGVLISDDGYRIRIHSARTREPLDLRRVEGRRVGFDGYLLPGDIYYVARQRVLGPCS